ncbi:hypothetical protein KM043_006411 [Ampulex compressa]|nr:hypothetical protein KM043_006411 [Ampulex compressa]
MVPDRSHPGTKRVSRRDEPSLSRAPSETTPMSLIREREETPRDFGIRDSPPPTGFFPLYEQFSRRVERGVEKATGLDKDERRNKEARSGPRERESNRSQRERRRVSR